MSKDADKLLVLYVMVAMVPGAPAQFFRCGHRFVLGKWRRVEVDAATAKRLHEEQMLAVTDEQPEGYEPEPEVADPAGQAEDAAERAEAAAKAAQAAAQASSKAAQAAAAKKR